ncbi:PRC-barrel domain-containing protein [Mycobacterium sp. MMS18-G62]
MSRVLGQDVRGPDGRVIGRLADLTVSLGEQNGPTLVDRMLVRRSGAHDLLVPWSQVGSFQHPDIQLASAGPHFVITSIADALDEDELLLVRDVLDTQIVDIAGQRLARVADVVLARSGEGRLEVVGVEVGFGAVLRRLGLGRLAARARGDAVAWTDLHLTSDRGHAVQLATPRSAVHLLDARGLAMLVSRLDIESATEVLAAKGPGIAAEVVRASHPLVGERVLRAMPDADAAKVVAAMPVEHARHWQSRLARPPVLRGRRLLRFHVWPRRRHTLQRRAGA